MSDPIHIVDLDDTIDLHAFTPKDVPSVVDEFLAHAIATAREHVRIIHGRGIGVQRAVVHRLLSQDARVLDYYDAPETHLGATIVVLALSTHTASADGS